MRTSQLREFIREELRHDHLVQFAAEWAEEAMRTNKEVKIPTSRGVESGLIHRVDYPGGDPRITAWLERDGRLHQKFVDPYKLAQANQILEVTAGVGGGTSTRQDPLKVIKQSLMRALTAATMLQNADPQLIDDIRQEIKSIEKRLTSAEMGTGRRAGFYASPGDKWRAMGSSSGSR